MLPQPTPFSPSWLSKPVDSGANQCSRSSSFLGYSKVWDSSIDLVSVLKLEIRDGQLSFRGKGVLELRFNDTSWDLCLLEVWDNFASWDSFASHAGPIYQASHAAHAPYNRILLFAK